MVGVVGSSPIVPTNFNLFTLDLQVVVNIKMRRSQYARFRPTRLVHVIATELQSASSAHFCYPQVIVALSLCPVEFALQTKKIRKHL